MTMDLSYLRSDFPMLNKTMHGHPLIYFDTAATSQKPRSVIDAMNDFYTNHYGTVHRAVYQLSLEATLSYQHVREKVATFINANCPEEIIYTRGTTESINLVAYSFGKAFIHPGDEIIVTEMEHHSNIVPWQILCEDRGAILKVVSINDLGELNLNHLKELLSEKTKICAVTHVSNALGTINPIKEIAKLVHEKGAKLLVDGAQAASHFQVDVKDLDVDFYVFSGHKLYGPTGVGILYGKKELLEVMPPYQGGGDMIEKVTFEKTTYNVLPMKFEAGTPMIAEVIGLGAAIDYIEKIGRNAIAAHEEDLLAYATNAMSKIKNLRIIGTSSHKTSVISFVIEGIHPLDLGTLLDLKGVAIRTGHHCTQPVMHRYNVSATARVSFGLYNTHQEIDSFVKILLEVISMLR